MNKLILLGRWILAIPLINLLFTIDRNSYEVSDFYFYGVVGLMIYGILGIIFGSWFRFSLFYAFIAYVLSIKTFFFEDLYPVGSLVCLFGSGGGEVFDKKINWKAIKNWFLSKKNGYPPIFFFSIFSTFLLILLLIAIAIINHAN
jgi:hypothetical protein